MRWSLRQAATEWGTNIDTLTRGLRVLGVEVRPKRTYTTRQIFTAIAGDLQHERTREARARADLLELEKRIKQGELFEEEQAIAMVRAAFQPFRQSIIALPAAYAARCNPGDPQLAREQLEIARDGLLRLLREYEPSPATAALPADPLLRS
jgi:hypothetical protein